MQFSESWLRSFCNPPLSTQALADTLTMGGFEVEELRAVAPAFTRVVVGEIRDAVQHPNADRLRVCTVDVGSAEMLQIVCGAPNARVGIKIPCALVGAELPPAEGGKPFVIQLGKLRGVESRGMLCSGRELGLSEDHGGLLELSADVSPGADIRRVLNLDDTLFTLKLTPNLGHALSVYGVARELSALCDSSLLTPAIEPVTAAHADVLPVRVSAPDLCGRFSGRIVRGIDPTAKTPDWMVERLARCGQRSVNALVDISNYVMFEYGRPSHIFDLDKIHGALDVRWAREGESLKLLNGNTIALDGAVGVIADESAVESLAGIMGGDATAVSDDTRNVYVEAAFWWPEAVQGRSRRFNFSTDAGHRFERGVDPSGTVAHIEHITRLILAVCGGQPGPIDDQSPRLPVQKPVALRVARAARVIGMPLDQAQCEAALRRLALPFEATPGVLTVTPPPHRFDLVIEEDLIEEVVRVIGYERLPGTPPQAPIVARLGAEARRSRFALRRQLAGLGYQETINFSFVEESWERDLAANTNPIRLLNPIASQMSVMRSSLLGSLLQALRFNLDRRTDRVRVFELGRVFMRDDSIATTDTTVRGVRQPMRVAGLAYGEAQGEQWGMAAQGVDFFDVKGDVEAILGSQAYEFRAADHPALHPGRSAEIWVGGARVGHVGELHPRWRQSWGLAQAPVCFELDLDAALAHPLPLAAPLSRFQPAQRDLALIVKDMVSHDALLSAIRSAAHGGLLREAKVFDLYKPKQAAVGMASDEKSVAVRLTLVSMDATLTDPQIDQAVGAVLESATKATGARLRA